MILTYKLRHGRNFSNELKLAFEVAKFTVFNKIKSPNTRFVKDIRGDLPSTIACQVMKKYGHQKNIKKVHNVNLIIPSQSIKYSEKTNSIRIPCLNLDLDNTIRTPFTKINQIEIDKEYAYVSCTVSEKPEMIPRYYIGVDRNTNGHIAVVANPTTGKIEKMGKKALHTHYKYKKIRQRLQKEKKFGEVKKIKNRESRISTDLNHKISRKIVNMAHESNAGIVLENLSGIRNTKKNSRSFRYALNSWSFYQIQTFIEYKSKLLGIPVSYVDPAYTSQDCSRCGTRGNRINKNFKCPTCGHVDHADVNAAFNIALRQQSMIDRTQKEMCTMGALIPHDAILNCPVTLEPPML